jgi:AraC family transcriptional regulator
MDGPASLGAIDAVAVMEQSPGVRLLYRFGHDPEELSVAKWQLDSASIATGDGERGILTIRTSGGATVMRRAEGEWVRKRPAIGEVTYASADTHARWTIEGSSEAMHIYIPVARVRRFADDELEGASPPRIRDFFAVVDPWLQGYFQMLASELEIFNREGRSADPLFFAQTEHLLLRHLLSWHSDAGAGPHDSLAGERANNPLPSRLMHRVRAYVDAHLADEIRLQDLADLACMSTGHFLRGFRVASGTTPYHYVLEQRLQRARSLLRATAQPVSRIAVECGFKTLSHLSSKFHGRFGISPTRFRGAAQPKRAS